MVCTIIDGLINKKKWVSPKCPCRVWNMFRDSEKKNYKAKSGRIIDNLKNNNRYGIFTNNDNKDDDDFKESNIIK